MAGRGTGITCSPLRRTETAFVFICVFPSPTFQTQGLRVLVTGPPSFSSPLKSSRRVPRQHTGRQQTGGQQ